MKQRAEIWICHFDLTQPTHHTARLPCKTGAAPKKREAMELINGKWDFLPADKYALGSFSVNGQRVATIQDSDDGVEERLAACANYCAGVPTAELESMGADAGFWGRACARVEKERDDLLEENTRLRAALKDALAYFGENDKTPAQHRMFAIVERALKGETP